LLVLCYLALLAPIGLLLICFAGDSDSVAGSGPVKELNAFSEK
jgi:hypothetical protein